MRDVSTRRAFVDQAPPRRLPVDLPTAPAIRWLGGLLRLTWLPFTIVILGRWSAASVDVVALSLAAFAVVQLGGSVEGELPIPAFILNWLHTTSPSVGPALWLALVAFALGRALETLVEWCLPWIHLRVNKVVTPQVVEAAAEPAINRIVDPPTAVQRWLLKFDTSSFIFESLAQTIGYAGSIVVMLVATYKANGSAGQVATLFLAFWIVSAVPLVHRALVASRRSALSHETVGRVIRDSISLRAELGRPSLRAYWRLRNHDPLLDLHAAIKWQGIWNITLFGILGLIARTMPVAAVIGALAAGSVGSALAVFLYLTRMATTLANLASSFPWLQQNLISVQRLFGLVGVDSEPDKVVPNALHPRTVQVVGWVVSFPDGSRICYPDLRLSRNHILCVVGFSGSGKSSLLGSLSGQVSANGTIFADGEPIVPSDPRWRESCAFVRQEPELVPGTLADNLEDFPLWKETPVRREAIRQILASRTSGASGSVDIDDKGVSVGQRRAVAVLRALGSGAPLLLLDEPLAGIDHVLVKPLADAIVEAHREGRIVVLTAHEHDLDRLDLKDARVVTARLDLPSKENQCAG